MDVALARMWALEPEKTKTSRRSKA
jgi:hypothetical protein